MSSSIDVAIIGAGPYGLSLAAHLRARGVDFRIFGKPMEYWKANMPEGMLLKSYPWASCLYDPDDQFTVKQYCSERGMPYHASLMALSLESFVAYGEAFQRRFVSNVEAKMVVNLESNAPGFRLTFDDETVNARHAVLAIGLHSFSYLPSVLGDLPKGVVSHSGEHGALQRFRGKRVIVLGAGASASDLAALLHEQGTFVSLVARGNELNFASPPRLPTVWERFFDPSCGIGSGWVLKACSDAPWLIRLMPEAQRLRLAKIPGPLGGAFMKDRVIGKVPVLLGRDVEMAQTHGNKVRLHLVANDGCQEVLEADHVIAATGYRIEPRRLAFLDEDLRSAIRSTAGGPVLSRKYETAVPGLYVIGPAAASSFGPVARFVFGAKYPARALAKHLSRVLAGSSVAVTTQPQIASSVLR